jgi:hypothetical protein
MLLQPELSGLASDGQRRRGIALAPEPTGGCERAVRGFVMRGLYTRYRPALARAVVHDGDGLPGHLGNPPRGGIRLGFASIRPSAVGRVDRKDPLRRRLMTWPFGRWRLSRSPTPVQRFDRRGGRSSRRVAGSDIVMDGRRLQCAPASAGGALFPELEQRGMQGFFGAAMTMAPPSHSAAPSAPGETRQAR